MILHIPGVLSPEQVRHCREVLQRAEWTDGRSSSGAQAGRAKNNLQVPEDAAEAVAIGELVVSALGANARFMSAALPLRLHPPLFNRYGPGMGYGDHIDNAIRTSPGGARYRTDLSGTLFLTDPGDYDGGELVIRLADATQRVKLPAGDLVLYPSTTVHRVEPVTRGERWASFFWVQSLAPLGEHRRLLYDLDQAIIEVRARLGDNHPAAVSLVGVYHNLVRLWSQP